MYHFNIMFVAVALQTNSKQQIPIPEEYVFGLSVIEDRLKTFGVNRGHNHRIYWADYLLNGAIPDTIANPPNFNLPIEREFPPHCADCCFLGRIKRFFSEYRKTIS